jgi:galactokinase/mevalonate kinase-like predicted kinase
MDNDFYFIKKGDCSMSEISKNVLNVVKSKTGKQVSEQTIKKLASGVNSSTLKNDAQLKSLILKVSKTVNVTVSNDTIDEIIRSIKSVGNLSSLEQVIKSMIKK